MSAFKGAMPQVLEEFSELVEKRPPRLTRREQQEPLEDISGWIDASMPDLMALEALKGDSTRAKEAYLIFDRWLRNFLQQMQCNVKPEDDALDSLLRHQFKMTLKVPATVKRLKQFQIVRQGLEKLIIAILNIPGGESAAQQLIEASWQKHGKEYMRFANSVKPRFAHYQQAAPKRITSGVITRLEDEYQKTSAAFEKRLRLLVGLNAIVRGKPETWEELRRLGYNELLVAVEKADNPHLHFLKDVIDRNVRNVLMHGGPSFSPSKKTVRFVDYSPGRKAETEVVWTVSKFYRKTKSLTITMGAVAQLESLFAYLSLYCLRERLRFAGIN